MTRPSQKEPIAPVIIRRAVAVPEPVQVSAVDAGAVEPVKPSPAPATAGMTDKEHVAGVGNLRRAIRRLLHRT